MRTLPDANEAYII